MDRDSARLADLDRSRTTWAYSSCLPFQPFFVCLQRRRQEEGNNQIPSAGVHLRRAVLHKCQSHSPGDERPSLRVSSPLCITIQQANVARQHAGTSQPLCALPSSNSGQWCALVSAVGFNRRHSCNSCLGSIYQDRCQAGICNAYPMGVWISQDCSDRVSSWALWCCGHCYLGS